MNNTKGITKIIIDYTPCYGNGSILTITDTYISCEYKNKDSRSLIWLYQSKSYEFRGVYAKITEFVEKHLEPTQKKDQADQYEILIAYDDIPDSAIKHTTSYIMFEEMFKEIHKLIPQLEEIPQGFDTEETAKKRIEELAGDMENKVPYEETEKYDID